MELLQPKKRYGHEVSNIDGNKEWFTSSQSYTSFAYYINKKKQNGTNVYNSCIVEIYNL